MNRNPVFLLFLIIGVIVTIMIIGENRTCKDLSTSRCVFYDKTETMQ